MSYVVLAAWLVQAAVGLMLLTEWLRHGRRNPPPVITHVGLSVIALGLWIVFLVTDAAVWGWVAFGLITIGNGFGDYLLIGRSRRLSGTTTTFFKDYGAALSDVLRGRLPIKVTFHGAFAGVVYFATLAACIIASV